MKVPANQAGKDEKNLPGKPGRLENRSRHENAAPSTSSKSMGGVKADKDKSIPDKTGSDVKSEAVSGKPAPNVKAGTAPANSGTGVKNQKGSNVKPGANLKSDQPAKSGVHSKAAATPKHHVKKSSRNPASRMHAKACASHPESCNAEGKQRVN